MKINVVENRTSNIPLEKPQIRLFKDSIFDEARLNRPLYQSQKLFARDTLPKKA